ncbi:hypothetical protein [Methylophaga sp. OBS4]|uniref:hypothetical protein n=1 Tax=Methylophaga sp. OBS4 TaxID=2991935 RepID=UPI00225BA92E|nr:hypothetical protein [Methylophaga sp. OBS4]MCX4188351.1 hypothetical protein [Methylophaga sp. OBS4]
MDIAPISVEITCLFCDSPLTGEEDANFESGDMIECAECGESNDYDSVLEVAKEKGMTKMTEKVQTAIEKEFSKLFK